uniref:Uncharacterized protein n=1 Tax=Anguilla anguilla TaxID=7936 RepID=A0A0E9XM00_ANGAN
MCSQMRICVKMCTPVRGQLHPRLVNSLKPTEIRICHLKKNPCKTFTVRFSVLEMN